MAELVRPHGSHLVDRFLRGDARAAARERARHLPRLHLDAWHAADVDLIANGAYSPLTGFMGSADYRQVLAEMHLQGGLPWSLPIVLPVSVEQAAQIGGAGGDGAADVALVAPSGRILAVMTVAEVFRRDRADEATHVYGTDDPAHPGVARLLQEDDWCASGSLAVCDREPPAFPQYALDPFGARQVFAARGWRTVVGFQTRNPVHRAHEYIQKAALEAVDGLFLHPLVGETKAGDVPADVRMESYRVLLANYYPPSRVVLGCFPAAMRYAGPREAVFHALVRKNYGCSHFIVGRDHAGVGNWYGTYDAQRLFSRFDPEALGVVPLAFDNAFFCRRCAGMASEKTCPHPPDFRISLSGTRVRELLQTGDLPPPEFSRPEVAAVLSRGMVGAGAQPGL